MIDAAALPRRHLLLTGLGAALGGTTGGAMAAASAAGPDAAAQARSRHFPFGPVVPPRPAAAWPLRTHRGAATDLAALLRGRVTALQLMFTGCSATCPIQGALFAQAQHDLVAPPAGVQWLSLSIAPLSDTPAALAAWLARFEAGPGWLAAAPRVEDLDAIVEMLTSGGEPRPAGTQDPHTGQVYVFDRGGRLVWRLASLPRPADIVAALQAIARRA